MYHAHVAHLSEFIQPGDCCAACLGDNTQPMHDEHPSIPCGYQGQAGRIS